MNQQPIAETGATVQGTARQSLAAYHRQAYDRALAAGRSARTALELSTAQGWMDHHGNLTIKLEGVSRA